MIVRLKPYLEPKLWGSMTLTRRYHPGMDEQIGEAWGISMIAGKESRIQDGDYKGMPFSILYKERSDLFGGLEGDFPLLIKVIDAQDDLSIQTHPKSGKQAKNEAWIVLSHKENARLIMGHKAKSKEEFLQALKEKKLEELLVYEPVKVKDAFTIEGGKLHGIGKGIEVFEIQQASDTTYRVYDYDRIKNGQPRPLHLREALALMNFPDMDVKRGIDSPYFQVKDLEISGQEEVRSHLYGDYLYIESGQGQIGELRVKANDFVFVSSNQTYPVLGDMTIYKSTIQGQ